MPHVEVTLRRSVAGTQLLRNEWRHRPMNEQLGLEEEQVRLLGPPSFARASGGSVPPREHPERSEGVPAAWRTDATLEMKVDATRVDAL